MSNRKLLGFDIDDLIKESLQGLFENIEVEPSSNMKEKLKQQQQVQDKKKRQKIYSGKKEDGGDEGDDSVSAEKPVKIKHESMPEVTVKSISNVINNIRAGKSLKDNETMSNIIQIRKNDGTSCNISTIYDETTNGKKVTEKNGDACI